jgi:phosphoserine aminotransferase
MTQSVIGRIPTRSVGTISRKPEDSSDHQIRARLDVSKRAYNFCAGPAALPEAVLQRAQGELLDWHGKGLSVMEMSHRSDEFVSIATQAEQDLRDLLNIPSNYKVLFLQGGASQQFAQIPLNLLPEGGSADYIDTGIWSQKAIEEASRYGHVNVAATAKPYDYFAIPGQNEWNLSKDAAYVHYAPNETIGGLEFQWIPQTGDVPLVADMSSDILSRPVDISRFGMIYAGAQKNIGPSGIVVNIIREDLLGKARSLCPTMLNYKVAADNGSMYNTPPTLAWYLSGLVFQWLKEQGGVEAIAKLNDVKQRTLYDFIDASGLYSNPINKSDRSWMNVPFRLADDRLDKPFLAGADERGLLNLKGHRSVGGMRASIYNAVDITAVNALVAYMAEFEKEHG